MRCIHRSLITLALLLIGATSASAQTAPVPDSAKVATLATVTVSAESGTWLTRSDDLRKSITSAMAENRRLASQLREHDERAMRLAIRLDSLKRIEFVQKIAIAAIDDSVAATRARRRAIEARILAAEAKQPQP
jgi:hypothetical protein